MARSILDFDSIEASDTASIHVSNPCEVANRLEVALDRLLAGEQVVLSRFGSDEVNFQRTDIPALRQRIGELRRRCAELNGRAGIGLGFVTPRTNKGWA